MPTNNMKAVQLISAHHWHTKLSRTRFLAVKPLVQNRITGKGWPGYDNSKPVADNLRSIFGQMPDMVFAYKPLEHRLFSELPCCKVMQYNEINEPRFLEEMRRAKPDLVVFHHFNNFLDYADFSSEGRGPRPFPIHIHIPHPAEPSIFYDSHTPRDIDVLLVGVLSAHIYPLRKKFAQAIGRLEGRSIRCAIKKHPGYEINDADSLNHLFDFAWTLNRAKVACFCSSVYKYRLEKYTEAMACGAVVASDIPESQDNIAEHIVHFEASEGVESIADRLEELVKSDLSERAEKAKRYAAQFTPESYCSRLLAAI